MHDLDALARGFLQFQYGDMLAVQTEEKPFDRVVALIRQDSDELQNLYNYLCSLKCSSAEEDAEVEKDHYDHEAAFFVSCLPRIIQFQLRSYHFRRKVTQYTEASQQPLVELDEETLIVIDEAVGVYERKLLSQHDGREINNDVAVKLDGVAKQCLDLQKGLRELLSSPDPKAVWNDEPTFRALFDDQGCVRLVHDICLELSNPKSSLARCTQFSSKTIIKQSPQTLAEHLHRLYFEWLLMFSPNKDDQYKNKDHNLYTYFYNKEIDKVVFVIQLLCNPYLFYLADREFISRLLDDVKDQLQVSKIITQLHFYDFSGYYSLEEGQLAKVVQWKELDIDANYARVPVQFRQKGTLGFECERPDVALLMLDLAATIPGADRDFDLLKRLPDPRTMGGLEHDEQLKRELVERYVGSHVLTEGQEPAVQFHQLPLLSQGNHYLDGNTHLLPGWIEYYQSLSEPVLLWTILHVGSNHYVPLLINPKQPEVEILSIELFDGTDKAESIKRIEGMLKQAMGEMPFQYQDLNVDIQVDRCHCGQLSVHCLSEILTANLSDNPVVCLSETGSFLSYPSRLTHQLHGWVEWLEGSEKLYVHHDYIRQTVDVINAIHAKLNSYSTTVLQIAVEKSDLRNDDYQVRGVPQYCVTQAALFEDRVKRQRYDYSLREALSVIRALVSIDERGASVETVYAFIEKNYSKMKGALDDYCQHYHKVNSETDKPSLVNLAERMTDAILSDIRPARVANAVAQYFYEIDQGANITPTVFFRHYARRMSWLNVSDSELQDFLRLVQVPPEAPSVSWSSNLSTMSFLNHGSGSASVARDKSKSRTPTVMELIRSAVKKLKAYPGYEQFSKREALPLGVRFWEAFHSVLPTIHQLITRLEPYSVAKKTTIDKAVILGLLMPTFIIDKDGEGSVAQIIRASLIGLIGQINGDDVLCVHYLLQLFRDHGRNNSAVAEMLTIKLSALFQINERVIQDFIARNPERCRPSLKERFSSVTDSLKARWLLIEEKGSAYGKPNRLESSVRLDSRHKRHASI